MQDASWLFWRGFWGKSEKQEIVDFAGDLRQNVTALGGVIWFVRFLFCSDQCTSKSCTSKSRFSLKVIAAAALAAG